MPDFIPTMNGTEHLHRQTVADSSTPDNPDNVANPANGEHQQQQNDQSAQGQCQAAEQKVSQVSSHELDALHEAKDAFARPMVLSLDAGGVRGYWSLLVLKMLMYEAAKIERELDNKNDSSFYPCRYPENITHLQLDDKDFAQRYLPCHYFDLIVGSSTGALSALMLGRLRMTVSDCMDEYKRLAGRIFANPKTTLAGVIPVFGGVKYEGKGAATAFEGLCARRASKSSHCDNVLFKTPRGTCRTCIATCRQTEDSGIGIANCYVHLRSYTSELPSSGETSRTPQLEIFVELERVCRYLQLWKVARAAIAANFIFQQVCIRLRTDSVYLRDGGMNELNSPVLLALEEGQKLSRTRRPSGVGILVSIGTARRDRGVASGGKNNGNARPFDPTGFIGARKLARQIFSASCNPEYPNEIVLQRHQQPVPEFSFFRFNNHGDTSHPFIEFDEWKPAKSSKHNQVAGSETLQKIEDNFRSWSERADVQSKITECARQLVEMRRLRIQHPSLWERHAEVSSYVCPELACRGGSKFKFRDQFEKHMDRNHNINGPRLDTFVKDPNVKQTWEYVSREGCCAWR